MPDYSDGIRGIHGKKVTFDTFNGIDYLAKCFGYIDAFNKTENLTDQFISSNNSDAPSGIWPYDIFRVLHKAYPQMRRQMVKHAKRLRKFTDSSIVKYSSLVTNYNDKSNSYSGYVDESYHGINVYAYAPTIKGPFVGYLQPDSGYKDWLNELGFYVHDSDYNVKNLVNPVSYTKIKVMDKGVEKRPNLGYSKRLATISPENSEFYDIEGKFTFYTYRFKIKRKHLYSSPDETAKDELVDIFAIIFGDQQATAVRDIFTPTEPTIHFIGPDHEPIMDSDKKSKLVERLYVCLDLLTKRIKGNYDITRAVEIEEDNDIAIYKYQMKQPKNNQIYFGRRGNDSSYLRLNNAGEPVISSNYMTQIGNDVQAFVTRSLTDRINYIYNYESFEDYYIPLGSYNLFITKNQNTISSSDYKLLSYDITLTHPEYWDENSRSDLFEVTDLTSNLKLFTSANELSSTAVGTEGPIDTRNLANTDLMQIISNLIQRSSDTARELKKLDNLVSKLNNRSGVNPDLDEFNGEMDNNNLRKKFLKW